MTTDVQGDDVPAGVAAGDVAVGGEAVVTLLDADDEWSAADALDDRCRAA